MPESLPVAGMTGDHRTSFTLPSPWYFRADVLEREKGAIFFRSWRCVCHGSALVARGSYATVDIHGQGVVAIRGQDGRLRAFYNVCQHRAHELLQGRGTVKAAITCPYHGWAYGTDGLLRSARLCDRVPDFDKEDFGLVPVRIQEFAGFIFVNLDDDAPPMNEWAPGFEEECRHWFPDLETVTFGAQKDFAIGANWKVIVENAIEGYHFPNSGLAHRELTDIIDMESTKLHVHDRWLAIVAPPGRNRRAVYPFPTSGRGGQTDHFITLYLWPDWIIYSWPHADMISTFLMRATGAQSSVVENAYYRVSGRGDDETTRASETWFNEALGPEDAGLNEGVQRGIVSKGYHQGRFISRGGEPGDSEHCVHAFQIWVRNALEGDMTS